MIFSEEDCWRIALRMGKLKTVVYLTAKIGKRVSAESKSTGIKGVTHDYNNIKL